MYHKNEMRCQSIIYNMFLLLLSEISLFHKYRIWNEFLFSTVFMKRVVCFISRAFGEGI